MSGKRKQTSLRKQTPNDKRRKPDPPKEYAVDSLLKLRTRVQFVRNLLTGLKTDKVFHQEYLVRWKNYDNSHDSWVSKEDISDDCIHQFNGVQIDTAAKMLAKVPVGRHPSSAGYAMSKMMSSMVKQTIVLKDGFHSPKKPSTNKLKQIVRTKDVPNSIESIQKIKATSTYRSPTTNCQTSDTVKIPSSIHVLKPRKFD